MLGMKGKNIVKTGIRRNPRFVIVPQIYCANHIVPTISARDPEDTGVFTLNFTSSTGVVGTVHVVLKAYSVVIALNAVYLVDKEQASDTVFKAKDQKFGQLVHNPKTKVNFESMRRAEDGARTVFNTYDAAQKKEFAKQQLCIDNVCTLMVSRKRERNNKELVSLAGLISTHPFGDVPNNFLVSKVAKGSVFNSNTHCFAFVDSQLRMFSTRVSKWSDAKLINGAFCDTAAYKEVAKTIRKVVTLQESMALCMSRCKKIVALHSDLPVDRLIRLMDYIKGQGDHSEDYEELSRLCAMSDRDLVECRRYVCTETFSATLYRAFRALVSVYFASRFTADQLEVLRTSVKSSKYGDRSCKPVIADDGTGPEGGESSSSYSRSVPLATTKPDESREAANIKPDESTESPWTCVDSGVVVDVIASSPPETEVSAAEEKPKTTLTPDCGIDETLTEPFSIADTAVPVSRKGTCDGVSPTGGKEESDENDKNEKWRKEVE